MTLHTVRRRDTIWRNLSPFFYLFLIPLGVSCYGKHTAFASCFFCATIYKLECEIYTVFFFFQFSRVSTNVRAWISHDRTHSKFAKRTLMFWSLTIVCVTRKIGTLFFNSLIADLSIFCFFLLSFVVFNTWISNEIFIYGLSFSSPISLFDSGEEKDRWIKCCVKKARLSDTFEAGGISRPIILSFCFCCVVISMDHLLIS